MNATVLVGLFAAAVLVLLGGFIGYSLAERTLDRQVRRQASAQRSISEQWRALRAAQARHREMSFRETRRAGERSPDGGAGPEDFPEW